MTADERFRQKQEMSVPQWHNSIADSCLHVLLAKQAASLTERDSGLAHSCGLFGGLGYFWVTQLLFLQNLTSYSCSSTRFPLLFEIRCGSDRQTTDASCNKHHSRRPVVAVDLLVICPFFLFFFFIQLRVST